jgi:hypothetical protein
MRRLIYDQSRIEASTALGVRKKETNLEKE